MSCHDLPCSYDIPYDVVVEILIRVPKRTLARFKWVCRECQHMICHDSWFHEMRRNYKIRRRICTRPHQQAAWILRMSDNRFSGRDRFKVGCEMKDCSEQGTLIKEFVRPHYYINDMLRDPPTPKRSANLLFYHTIYHHTYLYDIKTDRVQELHRASISYDYGSLSRCGFGYSWKSDEYKVFHLYKKEPNSIVTNCELYSTRKGSWRKISEECPCEVVHHSPVVVNDRIHWICYECIVSFDLNEEKFTTIPFSDPEQYYAYGYLTKLKGRLCLVSPPFSYIDAKEKRLRVWAVKDYCEGTWEYWCNISLYQFIFNDQRFYVSPYFKIFNVAYVGNGELVFATCFGEGDYREVYCDMREGGRITRVVDKAYGPIILCV